jgi:hypothetical protein
MRSFGKGLNPKAVRAFLAGFGSVLDLSETLSPTRRFHSSNAAARYHDWQRVGNDVVYAAETIKSRRNGKQFDVEKSFDEPFCRDQKVSGSKSGGHGDRGCQPQKDDTGL